MKKIFSLSVAVLVSLFCLLVMAMSCISYANANVVSESKFTMCRQPLTAEIEEVAEKAEEIEKIEEPVVSDEEQVYVPDIVSEDVEEDTIVIEPVEIEVPEVSVSEKTVEDNIETLKETPEVSQSIEPDIEEIIISDISTPETSVSPSVSETVVANYISGQLPLGNYAFGSYVGRLTIPSVGIDVAVYHSNSQSAVDAVDSSAAYYAYESQPDYANYTFVIADHNYQGFNAIKNCVIGTEAYITTANGTYSYVCDRIIPNGHNEGYGILDENYNLVYTNEGGMWLQTCNDTWTNDTLVHFYHK